MAFDFFKKKKKDKEKEAKFPAEEKKEVLKPKGNLPSPPKPKEQKSKGESKEGFKSMGDMTPSKPGEKMEEFKGKGSGKKESTSLPPFKKREPIPQKAPKPGPVKGKPQSGGRPKPPPPEGRGPKPPTRESGGPPVKKAKGKPHMYIKIDEYKKVMKKISELGEEIHQIRGELEDLKEVGKEERKNIEESKEITSKVNDILDYLQSTFTEATE